MEITEKNLDTTTDILGLKREDFNWDDFRRAIEIARELPIKGGYNSIGELKYFFENIEKETGPDYSELIARTLLLAFIDKKFWKPRCQVPESVAIELDEERERIKSEVLGSPKGHYSSLSDAFYKDFSILRGKSMPVYTGIVDTYTALWRRPLVFGALIQRVKFLRLLLKPPLGRHYFFQHHTHTSLLRRFNSEGWNRTYDLVAELLVANEDHKGFCGASWFYDPQLENISPRLVYLAADPIAGGAERFHLGEDHTGSALSKSNTRVKFYDQGKYLPQSYLLVWYRKSMISRIGAQN